MRIVSYTNLSELVAIEGIWDSLAGSDLLFVPSFSELYNWLRADNSKFRVLAAVDDNSQITALVCFIYRDSKKTYHIGARQLLGLPVRIVDLFGSCVIGDATEQLTTEFFNVIVKEGGFDLIDLGVIFVDSPLYKAAKKISNVLVWQVARKKRYWWLIRLPRTFDEYFSSLRARTRAHVVRDLRKCEREDPKILLMRRPEDVDRFLRDAEEISRVTYQWKLEYGVRNDEHTREAFLRLAENGMLRGYISYVRGKPCAFGWGDLSHGKFYFRQTGYDPKFRKVSPGTGLMMHMIRDMIENTDCRIFHFQWGGNEGYKARLCTESHICTSLQMAPARQPYSWLIVILDQLLNLLKNSIGFVVEQGPFKTRLRSALRRSGVGTF